MPQSQQLPSLALGQPGPAPEVWKPVQPDTAARQSRNIPWTEGIKTRLLFGGFGLFPICCQGKISPNVAETFKSPAEIVCEEGELLTVQQ